MLRIAAALCVLFGINAEYALFFGRLLHTPTARSALVLALLDLPLEQRRQCQNNNRTQNG